jgi:phage terminase large subunit-like protein
MTADVSPASGRDSSSEPTAPADYVDRAIAYAREAFGDRRRIRHCKWIRLAARRFLKDLKRAEKPDAPFRFDRDKANLHCEFIEGLKHVEGRWSSPTIKLDDWQIFFVVQLFGFRDLNGNRRFTTALLAIARKNAKSTLAAGILLSCLCLEPEIGPQVISAATTGSQARIVWNVAKRMVEADAELRETFSLEAFANAIARDENGGTCKPINAKASTQDGLNPSVISLDELHAHKTHDLLNVLASAAGARENPLWLYTTTEGYDNPGPWAETRAFAKSVLERVLVAEHFLAIYYTLDDEDDVFDETKWPKANPLMDSNKRLLIETRKLAIEAKGMPGRLAEFTIKRANRQAASSAGCINLHKWRHCAGEVPLDRLVGAPCWGALDLASTMDMTAWRLLWLLDGRWYTWGRYWVPEDAVRQRTERRSVPYASWVAQGLITQTSGDTVDYDLLERDILADCERFTPREIPHDPWNATQFVNGLLSKGLPMTKFIQGPKSYHPGWQAFEVAYVGGNLNHGGDPVLQWNASNLVARRDANMNFAPDRNRAADKIDGITALLMAFARATAANDNIFVFEGLTAA